MKETKHKSSEDNDKKKQIRLQKNRQSAALSRQRKKEYISNLQQQVTKVSEENSSYQEQVNQLTLQINTHVHTSKQEVERLEFDLVNLERENKELRGRLQQFDPNAEFASKSTVTTIPITTSDPQEHTTSCVHTANVPAIQLDYNKMDDS